MNYSNAQKGIKKIYNYEIVQIVMGLLALLVAVLSIDVFNEEKLLEGDKGAVGVGLVILVAGLAIVVLAIIGIIILIKGLKLASKDEPYHFKNAFGASIIVLIGSILSGLSSVVEFIGEYSDIINAAVSATNIFMFMCIIFGIRTLAEKIGRPDIVKLSVPIIAITIIISLVSAVGRFVEGEIMAIVSAVLSLISYIIYLIYLSKAKNMF